MSRVLVVEDDPGLAHVIVAELEARGCEVILARTIDAAYEAVSGDAFAVILCDYELPVSDGGLNTGRGTTFLNSVLDQPRVRPFVVLWSGLDRSREAAAEMPSPPDHLDTKNRLPEVLDLVAARAEEG